MRYDTMRVSPPLSPQPIATTSHRNILERDSGIQVLNSIYSRRHSMRDAYV